MKRLIFLLIALTIFTISCIPITMANFFVYEMDKGMSNSMQQEVINTGDFCNVISSECTEDNHSCCIFPVNDSNLNGINVSINNNKKIKGKILDVNIFALIQESLDYNYIDKLTSPPNGNKWEKEENFYITLTGIIKCNC